MTFEQKHRPRLVSDLIFRSQDAAKKIGEYAAGERTKHLLLYGPAGSGKSEAARVLVDTLCPGTAGSMANEHINPKNFKGDNFNQILSSWNAQMSLGGAARGFIVIDEVDWFAEKMKHQLRSFIDDHVSGTLICTTNNLHLLDDPLKSRFLKLHIEWPTANDWLPRAQSILAAEGFNLTKQEVAVLLQGFAGDARALTDWLEGCVIALKAKAPPSPPITPVLTVINGGGNTTTP